MAEDGRDFRGSLPDFVVVGTQKGGTSSLYKYLCQHPSIAPAVQKEIHFFDREFHRGTDWYRLQFPVPHTAGVITGEATPYYLFHPRVAERMARTIPSARLIAVLRDPVDRAYSQFHMEAALGREQATFAEAVERERRKLPAEEARMVADEGYRSLFHQRRADVARGLYGVQIARLLEYFPRGQLLVIVSEDLFSDPQRAVDMVTDFLRLERHPLDDVGAERVGGYERTDRPMEASLRASFATDRQRLAELVGHDFPWPL